VIHSARSAAGVARRVAAGAVAVALAGALAGGIPGIANAESVADAQAQAASIAASIAALQPQVDQAVADYDAALNALGQSVDSGVAAERAATTLRAQAVAAEQDQNAHAVALYESGGSAALLVSALGTGDLGKVAQLPMLSGLVSRDAARAATARRVALAAQQRSDDAQGVVSDTLTSAAEVNQKLQQMQGLLAQQQALLDAATAKERQLEALQKAAEELAAARAAAAQATADAAASADAAPVPANYRAWFQAAAKTCPGLSWTILAAIGQVETHDGQGTMVSSAGALGPMQFLPATFAHYAVDGDNDGRTDIWDPADAIFTAAHYLCANGGGQGGAGLYSAIWNYNHADWYVQLVLAIAAKIS
jgi:hypothetical protein